mmetsp:Transcript_22992/g.40692  ORF Transcript_22992/g.40692 Transcript_22992/m.40692 type:complete len:237 (-) Transcript_22992:366-1076(-)
MIYTSLHIILYYYYRSQQTTWSYKFKSTSSPTNFSCRSSCALQKLTKLTKPKHQPSKDNQTQCAPSSPLLVLVFSISISSRRPHTIVSVARINQNSQRAPAETPSHASPSQLQRSTPKKNVEGPFHWGILGGDAAFFFFCGCFSFIGFFLFSVARTALFWAFLVVVVFGFCSFFRVCSCCFCFCANSRRLSGSSASTAACLILATFLLNFVYSCVGLNPHRSRSSRGPVTFFTVQN